MDRRPRQRDDILHPRRVQRVLLREGRLAQLPPVLGQGRLARLGLRGRGAHAPDAAAGRALRDVRVAQRQGVARLPRHRRLHALFRRPFPHRRAGRREADLVIGLGDARRGDSRRASEAARPQGPVLHERRAHAGEPCGAGQPLVAGSVRVVGEAHRPRDRGRDRARDGKPPHRRAVLRLLPQHTRAVEDLHARPPRARVRQDERRLGAPQLHGPEERDPGHEGGGRRGARQRQARPAGDSRRAGRPREVGRAAARRGRLQEGR